LYPDLNLRLIVDVETMMGYNGDVKLLVVMVEVGKVVEYVLMFPHVIEVMYDFLVAVNQQNNHF
jgi:hypothetical protein